MESVFEERTRSLQGALRDRDVDCVVLFPSPNLYYLTGFWEEPMERQLFLFVPASGDPAFVAPELYRSQLQESTWIADIRPYGDDEDPQSLIAATARDLDFAAGHLLLDPTMWALFTLDLRDILSEASFGLADEVMAERRRCKDELERRALQDAGSIADDVMEWVRAKGSDVVGMSETELAAGIGERLRSAADGDLAFEPVVGSGPNGAKPHHRHADREIRPGDPVVLDFGVRQDQYPSDTTRTVVFDGEPPDTFREVHSIVKEAQQEAIETVEPGIPAERVDAAARAVIEDAGYGDQFIHRTGHGVGLSVHEEPYIVSGNETPLEPGMVFSVEPGIYLEAEFGVRIEDLVLVTADGAERLNTTDRGWEATESA
ncbi:MAG: M24 family metallopeptidase [Halanaeroarchaeum sp.]